MVNLQSIVTTEWPENKSEFSQELNPFWNFCDKLSAARGIGREGGNSSQSEKRNVGQERYTPHIGYSEKQEAS